MRLPTASIVLIALVAAACSEGDGPVQPPPWVLAALELEAEVVPRHAIAGDTVDVVVTLTNEQARPITLRGTQACVVSSLRVSNDDEPVAFVGSGEPPCPGEESLSIPASASTEVRVKLVVWQEPDSTTSPFIDGPPWPTGYRITVRSELLGREADANLTVLRSGLHDGHGEVCGPAPADSDSVGIVLRPDVIGDVSLRVRYEVHNRSVDPFSVELCNGPVVATIDRREGEEWVLGERTTFCSTGNGTGWLGVPVGGCVRSVAYERDYVPGEYRLRIWTNGGVLTTGSMVFDQ